MKEFQQIVKTILHGAVILSLLSILLACSSNEGGDTVTLDGDNMEVKFAVPAAVDSVVGAGLEAEVSLNGADPIELTVDSVTNTINGTILGVSPGTHEITITYFIMLDGEKTVLATVTKSGINVTSGGEAIVNIASGELDRTHNSDGDGYTNLAEVLANTDPHDASSSPSVPSGFAVGHGSFIDTQTADSTYSMQGIVGEPANGSTDSDSNSYKMTAGFSSY